MPLSIRHNFVSHKVDEPDITLLRPSNWNEDHTITGSLDVFGNANWQLFTTGIVATFQGIGTLNTVLRLTQPTGNTYSTIVALANSDDAVNAGRWRVIVGGTLAVPALTAGLQSSIVGTGTGITTQYFGEELSASTLTSIQWQFHGVTTATLTPTLFTAPTIGTSALTVATLPVSPVTGQRAFVTDSNAASLTAGIGAVVAAGGTTHVPVLFDGTNWRIA